MAELMDSIHECLFHLESRDLLSLAQNLASESKIQLEMLWAIVECSDRGEKLIGYLDSLSSEEKRRLVGTIILRLLRKLWAFIDHNGFSDDKISPCSNTNSVPRSYSDIETRNCRAVSDTDVAYALLVIYEAHEQECLDAEKKWRVDPVLYRNLFSVDKKLVTPALCLEWLKNYISQNILKVAYNVPSLMVDEIESLRWYIDLIHRYLRLLRMYCDEITVKENTCPAASAATILSLPSAVYIAEGNQCRVCPICGDKFEGGLSVVSCLPCSHVYHWKCIHTWLKTRNTCPLCRNELPTDDLFYEINRHMKLFLQRKAFLF